MAKVLMRAVLILPGIFFIALGAIVAGCLLALVAGVSILIGALLEMRDEIVAVLEKKG